MYWLRREMILPYGKKSNKKAAVLSTAALSESAKLAFDEILTTNFFINLVQGLRRWLTEYPRRTASSGSGIFCDSGSGAFFESVQEEG
jgi:hypothetical protein